MKMMNALKRAFQTASFLGLAVAVGAGASGCGEVKNMKCTTDQECINAAANKTQPLVPQVDGGDNPLNPVCCGGYCLLPAEGCDPATSGTMGSYRYETDDPGYGLCAPVSLENTCK